jgi:hypothetical protein
VRCRTANAVLGQPIGTANDADMMSSPGPIMSGAKRPSLACTQKTADIDSKPNLSDLLDVQHLERATDPLKKLYRRDGEDVCF